METEKVNTGETVPDKDFLDRVGEIADELRDMVQKDRENRVVLLIAGDGNLATRLLQGHADRLTNISGRSLAADEEGSAIMLGIIINWLGSIDTLTALSIAKVLHETMKQRSKEEVSRPKAEA